MNLPSDTPKLPKWIFLLGDVALLATAYLIADIAAHPTQGLALISIVACVIAAGILGAIPFVSDYARRQDEALDNRQRSLQALSVTMASAAEQVSIATTGLNGIAEAAQANFSKSERLAHQIQERMAEFDGRLAAAKKGDAEAMAKLESLAKALSELEGRHGAAKKGEAEILSKLESLAKALSELDTRVLAAGRVGTESAARLESLTRKIGEATEGLERAAAKAAEAAKPAPVPAPVDPMIAEVPPVPLSKIVEIKPAVASSVSPFVEPERLSSPPAPAQTPEAAPAPLLESAPAETAPVAAPAPRKRSPRKPAAAPAPEAPEPKTEEPAPELVLESPPSEEPALGAVEVAEPAVSADGATRLIVTAYIGIGNRLFIRGDGPGLSREKGVPLSFVSIGKWRWETNEASRPVAFSLYKNDETPCTALGERTVAPGAQLELTASF